MSNDGTVDFPWTSDWYRKLYQVNQNVNNGTRYVTDQVQYNTVEFWANADTTKRGDCEDFAEAKYCRLRALGFPKTNLNFVVCEVEGQGHAVLKARLGDIDYILDNNLGDVLPFDDVAFLKYEWKMTTKDGSFEKWYKVG